MRFITSLSIYVFIHATICISWLQAQQCGGGTNGPSTVDLVIFDQPVEENAQQ